MNLTNDLEKRDLTRRRIITIAGLSVIMLVNLPTYPAFAKTIVVESIEELKEAQKSNTETIIIKGELAKQLHDAKSVSTLRKGELIGIASSVLIGSPLAGISDAIILAIISLGISGILAAYAIHQKYNEVEFSAYPPTLKLRRK